jgi:crotonobetainyl-CoA:carnitine CoA-transferase CaiB-like acyl-CoA transferase
VTRGPKSLRVVEIVGSRAGSVAARLLDELGASVTRILPRAAFVADAAGTDPANAAHEAWLCTGRVTERLDLDTREGVRALREHLAGADVSIESAAPGPLRPRPEPAEQPGLVRVLVSPLGTSGPLAGLRSNDFTDEAVAGHLLLNGEPGRLPIARPGRLASYQAGLHAAIGALAALRERTTTERSRTVEVGHIEGLVALHQHTVTMWTHDRHVLHRQGNRQPGYWHPTGVYACRGGHVALAVVGQAARERLLCAVDLPEALLDPRFADDLAVACHKDALDGLLSRWLRERTVDEVVPVLQSARVAAAAVESAHALLDDPHLAARGALADADGLRVPRAPWSIVPPLGEIGGTGPAGEAGQRPDGRPGSSSPPGTTTPGEAIPGRRPLAGVRVLDLGRVWAGPLAGRVLADLGADVIAVESPDARGGRTAPPGLAAVTHLFPDGEVGERPWNRIGSVNALQRGKRGITLDLRRADARGLLEQLAAEADVLVENLGPGVLDGFGLGPARLHTLNPSLVLASISGLGPGGPDAHHVAFGPVIEARAGITHAMGYPGGGPMRSGIAWPDPIAALHAVAALLAALRDRDADPERRAPRVEVPMLESALFAVPDVLFEAQTSHADPPRRGSRDPRHAPQGVYPCRGDDRFIAISVTTDAEWRSLRRVLDLDAALDSLGRAARARRHDAIDAAIAERTRHEDPVTLTHRLQAAGVLAFWLADARDLLESEQLAARGFWLETGHADARPRPEPACPIRLDGAACRAARPAPRLGEHNREVLAEWLGLGDAALAELEASGVLVDAPPV